MRISSIELTGFKSFHRKTRLEFHKGSNGIVGPNGCGKSNVIDAIRWVIGEQNPRMLRAGSMEDLISDGTVSLKPVGMAEVVMTLADVPGTGFNEVSITRRYFRDGDSRYFINGTACRLKDIVDIFTDTGAGARAHSIIGQGEVEGFVLSKPEEKRRLIEEVAGIVRYKDKRKETHARLKQTEENLTKVRALVREADRRKENLRRQAEQAEKLNEITGEAARLEISLLGAQKLESEEKLREASASREDAAKAVAAAGAERSSALERLKSLETRAQALEEEVTSADTDILAVREQINGEVSRREIYAGRKADIEALVGRLESEKLSLERQAADARGQIATTRQEAEKSLERLAAIRRELGDAESEMEAIRSGPAPDTVGVEEVRERFFSAVERCDKAGTRYRELTGETLRLSGKCEDLSGRRDDLVEEKERLAARREEFASQIAEAQKAREQAESKKKEVEGGIGSLGGEHEKLRAGAAEMKERLSGSRSRLAELSNIQKSFEWLPESSRKLLLEGGPGGALGVLSDYAEVPAKYAKAFEAALGERLGWIVVGTGDDARRAIEKLRESKTGRATFVPETVSGGGAKVSPPPGARLISEVIKTRAGGGDVIGRILEGVCVVSDLAAAFECAKGSKGLSFATLEGDFLDAGGAVCGGWMTGGVFERKSEIERLTAEIPVLEAEIAKKLEEAGGFEARIGDLKSEMASLDESIQTARAQLGSLERDLKEFNFSIEGREAKLREIDGEIAVATKDLKEKNALAAECRDELERLQAERDGQKKLLGEFEARNTEIEERGSGIAVKIGDLKIEMASLEQGRESSLREAESLAAREKEITGRISEITEEAADRARERAEIDESAAGAGETIERLEKELEEKRAGADGVRESRGGVISQAQELRERLAELDKRLEETRSRRGDVEVGIKTMENNIEYLSGEMDEVSRKHGVEAPGEDALRSVEIDKTKTEFEAIKARVERFGLVNLLAPEEYEEAAKEHGFLETQIEDLEKSADSLKKSISRLDRESAEKFAAAFEDVDIKFRELLPTLFKGGEGRLVMTNPDDPIETGVDIVVKPGGKKAQSMSLLSGGEKALSAIAFIISSCLVRPLPFIILDEIDAPLDDSNTGRFASLINDISRNSQTIIVTHNKTTISDVDALIGITSSKASNSAVVSVDLAKAV